MGATAAQIAALRDMCALEPGDAKYTDADLAARIETYPLRDEAGTAPYWLEPTSGGLPPTQVANDNWVPTYDLNAAAADVWDHKAAALAGTAMDFSAEGGSFSRSQLFQNARRQAAYYRSKRAIRTLRLGAPARVTDPHQRIRVED